jgi:hypothetical protein
VHFFCLIVTTKDNDRSAHLRNGLTSHNIPYKCIFSLSVDSNKEEISQLKRPEDLYGLTIGRDILLSEIAASYGHELAYKELLDSQYQWALVLEDDVEILNYGFLSVLESVDIRKPRLVYLARGVRILPRRENSSREIVDLIAPGLGALAYFINRKAAEIYWGNYQRYGITSVADWPYPQPRQIRFSISKVTYFREREFLQGRTISNDRKDKAIHSSEQALSMPISYSRLLRRSLQLRKFGFSLTSLFFHELILRFFYRFQSIKRFIRIRLSL